MNAGLGVPSSSIQPRSSISCLGRWRCSGVMMPPGCTALASTPSSAQRCVTPTAKSEFAVFDWP
ncbi:hypothetical protein ASL10_14145 [Frigoribacterium sp. Leaf8]|nr:hypothetical protein ASL10_14145 [Frigoribacterium sp. Leaf8]